MRFYVERMLQKWDRHGRMSDKLFRALCHRRIANISASPSALRNQGREGVVADARGYLCEFPLGRRRVASARAFSHLLDRRTKELQAQLGRNGSWGLARKVLNIFLLEVVSNRFLYRTHSLREIQGCLEVPLDSQVAKELRAEARKRKIKLPEWRGVSKLDPDQSAEYQRFAAQLAKEWRIARVYLDLVFWRRAADTPKGVRRKRRR